MTERGNTERRIKNSLLDSKKEGVQYGRGQRSCQSLRSSDRVLGARVRFEKNVKACKVQALEWNDHN